MKPIWIIFLISLACLTKAQGQSYQWLTGGGSGTNFTVFSQGEGLVGGMCFGKDGNIYFLTSMGGFYGITADTFHRPSAWGQQQNFFVCSYTPDGHMRWGKLVGGTLDASIPIEIACDTLGHVYVIGAITNGTSHIGGDTTMSVYNYNRNCIIQFDTAGHFKWIHFPGANTFATLVGSPPGRGHVFIDSLAHPHFINWFSTGVQITPTLSALSGVYDLEYDLTGNLLTVTRLALDTTLYVRGCIVNKATGRLYTIGEMISGSASPNSFVAAFDAARNLIWKDTLRSANPSYSKVFSDIKEQDGYLYLSGAGYEEVSFQSDTVKNILMPGFVLGLVAKVDTAGHGVWMKGISGSSGVGGLNSLCMLDDHKLAVVGTMVYKQKCGTDSLQSYTGEGQNPMFVIVDTAGDLFTLQQLHGNGFYDGLWHCAADHNGALYMRGYVESQVWAGSLTPYTSVGGSSDYYIMKYGPGAGCTGSGPVAAFTATGSHTVSFTYTAPTAGMDSVRWFFGDGGTSTVWNPTHVYAATGSYHVYVRVYSYCGGDVTGKDIGITCPAIATPAFTDAGGKTKTFTYTASTTGADSVLWRFGDGGTSNAWSPTHTYAANGVYTVCVTVWSWCSRDSLCDTVHVSGLGVAGMEQVSWRVLPNPAKDYLEVQAAAGALLQVYDLPGRAVLEAQVSSNSERITISQLAAGTYIIQLTGNGHKQVIRLVKE